MIQTICPTTQEIADYLHGKLSEDDSNGIEQHLAGCSDCEQAASRLDASGDSLMRYLRLKPENAEHDDDWQSCRVLLRQLPARVDQASPPADAIFLLNALRPESVYHYRLGRQLGHGGMGVVYQSMHPQLHRPVAVKILSASRASDAPSIARFQREMRAAGGLDHDGIVRAVDAGVWQGTYYLVMEYVDGIDLSRLVRQSGPLAEADAAAIIVRAAKALQYAHEHQVIHRDIKPSNVMLTRDGSVKILDFGLARLEHGGLTNHDATTAGRLLGTLDYLSPEQAAGQQPIDARADLYGLGATLFKLLAGRPPHGSSQDRPILQHLQRLTSTAADSLADVRQDLNREFCQIVARLLDRDPHKRPESAQQVVDLVRPFSADANLIDLAEHAMTEIDLQQQEQSESEDSVSFFPAATLAAKDQASDAAKPTEASPQPATASQRGGGWFLLTAVASLLIGLLGGFAALTFWIQTGEATLKIESEVDQVSLQLIQDGRIAKEIEVHPGNEVTRIRAGKYELRIDAKTDNVRADQRSLLVMRGDERMVRITREEKSVEPSAADTAMAIPHPGLPAGELSADAPTSRGRTYQQWDKIVLRETDATTVTDGVKALVELSTAETYAKTLGTLLSVAERNESKLSLPPSEAYIHYLIPKAEGDYPWDKLYPKPPDSWTMVVTALDEGISQLRSKISDSAVNQILENGTQASRRIVLAAELNSDANRVAKTQLCLKLCDPGQPISVRAMAHQALLQRLAYTPDETTKDALNSDDPLLAKAVVVALFEVQKFPFPQEQGLAAGSLIARGMENIADYIDTMITQAADEGKDFRERDTRQLLESVGSAIVMSWEDSSPPESKLAGIETVRKLAALNLMTAATRRSASQRLHSSLQRLMIERDKLTQPTALATDLAIDVYSSSQALAFLEGKVPKELETFPLSADSRPATAIDDWVNQLAQNPEAGNGQGAVLKYLYPLEAAEAIFKAISTRPKKTLDPYVSSFGDPRASRGQRDRLLESLEPWLAIPIAARDPGDVKNQSAIGQLLDQLDMNVPESQWPFWIPGGDANDLSQIAAAGSEQRHRAIALRMAQISGADDQKVQQLALQLLIDSRPPDQQDNKQGTDIVVLRWCLACLADADDLVISKDQLVGFSSQVLKTNRADTKSVLVALKLNRRLGISSLEDEGLIHAAVGMESLTNRLRWPQPNRRVSGIEDVTWRSMIGPVPRDIVEAALEAVIANPSKDQKLRDHLESMKVRVQRITGFAGVSDVMNTEPVRLLQQAIEATSHALAE